jgi:predicted N-acetyltransferase YhbS
MSPVEIRGARAECDVDAAYDLAARTFGPNYFEAKDAKVRVRALEPLSNPADAVIAVHDGDVIGFVRIVDRSVWLGGQELPVGGITSVAVRPDFRGQGLGRRIMEFALERSRERGDILSIAFARRAVDGFYWRIGYVGLGCHPDVTVQAGLVKRDKEIETRAGFDKTLGSLYRSAYADSYAALPMSFSRSDQWWSRFPDRLAVLNSGEGQGLHTVFAADQPVGYFVAHSGRIIEIAASAAATVPVMNAVVSHGGAKDVSLAVPLGHWSIAACRPRNHTLRVRHAWDGGHVVRVLDNSVFCDALASAIAEPARVAAVRQLDVADHAAARRVLMCLAGIDAPDAAPEGDMSRPVPLLPTLPSWTPLDEF